MIIFDEVGHTYTNESGNILPSVTQILSKVYGSGLEGAPEEFVKRAGEKGTAIHKEIEEIIKGNLPETLFPETANFLEYSSKLDLKDAKSEVLLYGKTEFGEICGTADLVTKNWLYDFKTSKTATKKQKEKWQKQLTFYVFMLRQAGYNIEGMTVLHLTDEKCEPIVLEYLGDNFVIETMKLYSEGKKAERHNTELATVSQKELSIFEDIVKRIKVLEESIAPIKDGIKAEMEKRNILSLTVGDIDICYIAPSKRKSFDSTKFKAEHSDLYQQYLKESEVKSSIRIKVKGAKNAN